MVLSVTVPAMFVRTEMRGMKIGPSGLVPSMFWFRNGSFYGILGSICQLS